MSGALTIGKTAATITVTPYAVTYNGSPLTATGTATGIGRVSLPGLTLNTTHTAVGTYNDTWTFTDSTGNYNNASGTITDTILPASLVITASSASMIYGGAAGHAQLYGIRKQPERVRPDDSAHLRDGGNQHLFSWELPKHLLECIGLELFDRLCHRDGAAQPGIYNDRGNVLFD